MVGIIGRSDAHAQHVIVTGSLTFDSESANCNPNQWVDPIQAIRRIGQHLYQPITSLHMGQFVDQDHTTSLI